MISGKNKSQSRGLIFDHFQGFNCFELVYVEKQLHITAKNCPAAFSHTILLRNRSTTRDNAITKTFFYIFMASLVILPKSELCRWTNFFLFHFGPIHQTSEALDGPIRRNFPQDNFWRIFQGNAVIFEQITKIAVMRHSFSFDVWDPK